MQDPLTGDLHYRRCRPHPGTVQTPWGRKGNSPSRVKMRG
jgi:hypothetical protein